MKLTNKEKTLLIVLIVMVYAFISVKFVFMPSLPKMKDAKNRIETAQIQLDALEEDYRNIKQYKDKIKQNEVINDRLSSYITNSASISDSIHFVENLAVLMGTSLQSISLGSPQQNVEGGATYYAFPVNFSTILTEDGLDELIKYCEGGSKKVTIKHLTIDPASKTSARESNIFKSGKQHFELNIGLLFYSMDEGTANTFLKSTRAAFERFINDNDIPIFVEDAEELPNTPTQTTQVSNTGSSDFLDISYMNADFIVFHRGYLFGGHNFETFSRFAQKRIQVTVDDPMDVTLNLGKTQYTIDCIDGDAHTYSLTGNLEDRDYTLYIQSQINTQTKENEELWLNIKIINDSGHSIHAMMEQTGDRVKIFDRDGNAIEGKSDTEKVYFQ